MSAVFICERPERDEVAAGALLLDQLDAEARSRGVFEPDWDTQVAPGRIDVDSPTNCPLGQLDGDFDSARVFGCIACGNALFLVEDVELRAKLFGFYPLPTPGQEDDESDPGNAPRLNERWREETTARAVRRAKAQVLAA